MKKFIILQMKVDSEERKDDQATILISNIVRVVNADSKELAIGKFVVATQDMKAIKKLDIECYDITELITL